jgi:hypothetical protein
VRCIQNATQSNSYWPSQRHPNPLLFHPNETTVQPSPQTVKPSQKQTKFTFESRPDLQPSTISTNQATPRLLHDRILIAWAAKQKQESLAFPTPPCEVPARGPCTRSRPLVSVWLDREVPLGRRTGTFIKARLGTTWKEEHFERPG